METTNKNFNPIFLKTIFTLRWQPDRHQKKLGKISCVINTSILPN